MCSSRSIVVPALNVYVIHVITAAINGVGGEACSPARHTAPHVTLLQTLERDTQMLMVRAMNYPPKGHQGTPYFLAHGSCSILFHLDFFGMLNPHQFSPHLFFGLHEMEI